MPTKPSQVSKSISSLLHITAVATIRGDLTSVPDVRMVKAALLYADRVTLCSAHTATILLFLRLRAPSFEQKFQVIKETAPFFMKGATGEEFLVALPAIEAIIRKKRKSPSELRFVWGVKQSLDQHCKAMYESILGLADAAGTSGIQEAMNSGLLEIHRFRDPSSPEAMIEELVNVATSIVNSPSTYPLLDDQTSGLISALVQEGRLSPSAAATIRGRSVQLAADLFHRLPVFDNASVDEVLSVRSELERPLVRFRAGLVRLSEQMRSAPWDSGFPEEVELLVRSEIEPAILEIEDEVKSRSALRTLLSRLAERPMVPLTGSALSIVLARSSFLPEALTTAVGLGATAALTGYDTYKKWQADQREVEQNQFFFYYRLRNDLG